MHQQFGTAEENMQEMPPLSVSRRQLVQYVEYVKHEDVADININNGPLFLLAKREFSHFQSIYQHDMTPNSPLETACHICPLLAPYLPTLDPLLTGTAFPVLHT